MIDAQLKELKLSWIDKKHAEEMEKAKSEIDLLFEEREHKLKAAFERKEEERKWKEHLKAKQKVMREEDEIERKRIELLLTAEKAENDRKMKEEVKVMEEVNRKERFKLIEMSVRKEYEEKEQLTSAKSLHQFSLLSQLHSTHNAHLKPHNTAHANAVSHLITATTTATSQSQLQSELHNLHHASSSSPVHQQLYSMSPLHVHSMRSEEPSSLHPIKLSFNSTTFSSTNHSEHSDNELLSQTSAQPSGNADSAAPSIAPSLTGSVPSSNFPTPTFTSQSAPSIEEQIVERQFQLIEGERRRMDELQSLAVLHQKQLQHLSSSTLSPITSLVTATEPPAPVATITSSKSEPNARRTPSQIDQGVIDIETARERERQAQRMEFEKERHERELQRLAEAAAREAERAAKEKEQEMALQLQKKRIEHEQLKQEQEKLQRLARRKAREEEAKAAEKSEVEERSKIEQRLDAQLKAVEKEVQNVQKPSILAKQNQHKSKANSTIQNNTNQLASKAVAANASKDATSAPPAAPKLSEAQSGVVKASENRSARRAAVDAAVANAMKDIFDSDLSLSLQGDESFNTDTDFDDDANHDNSLIKLSHTKSPPHNSARKSSKPLSQPTAATLPKLSSVQSPTTKQMLSGTAQANKSNSNSAAQAVSKAVVAAQAKLKKNKVKSDDESDKNFSIDDDGSLFGDDYDDNVNTDQLLDIFQDRPRQSKSTSQQKITISATSESSAAPLTRSAASSNKSPAVNVTRKPKSPAKPLSPAKPVTNQPFKFTPAAETLSADTVKGNLAVKQDVKPATSMIVAGKIMSKAAEDSLDFSIDDNGSLFNSHESSMNEAIRSSRDKAIPHANNRQKLSTPSISGHQPIAVSKFAPAAVSATKSVAISSKAPTSLVSTSEDYLVNAKLSPPKEAKRSRSRFDTEEVDDDYGSDVSFSFGDENALDGSLFDEDASLFGSDGSYLGSSTPFKQNSASNSKSHTKSPPPSTKQLYSQTPHPKVYPFCLLHIFS